MKRTISKMRIEMPLLWLGITASSGVIFVLDTITDLEIAVAVLYSSVILLSVRSGSQGATTAVALGCSILTIVSFLLTPHGNEEAGIVNCGLSIVAIGGTTYLANLNSAIEARLRQAQANLARISRITTLGELATTISHEVSQPLAAIVANSNAALRWLAANPPNESEAKTAVERVVADADRGRDVINRVRKLVTHMPPSRVPVDLTDAIREVLLLSRGEIRRHDIQLQTELADDLPMVLGDRVQLQQVLLNYIVNAVEAMATPGPVPHTLLVRAIREDKSVAISICDTGVGLTSTSADKVFEAFHTTKPGGMGLGLSISRAIIDSNGGEVYAAANFPRGAVFGFSLPLAEELGNRTPEV